MGTKKKESKGWMDAGEILESLNSWVDGVGDGALCSISSDSDLCMTTQKKRMVSRKMISRPISNFHGSVHRQTLHAGMGGEPSYDAPMSPQRQLGSPYMPWTMMSPLYSVGGAGSPGHIMADSDQTSVRSSSSSSVSSAGASMATTPTISNAPKLKPDSSPYPSYLLRSPAEAYLAVKAKVDLAIKAEDKNELAAWGEGPGTVPREGNNARKVLSPKDASQNRYAGQWAEQEQAVL